MAMNRYIIYPALTTLPQGGPERPDPIYELQGTSHADAADRYVRAALDNRAAYSLRKTGKAGGTPATDEPGHFSAQLAGAERFQFYCEIKR